MSTTAASQPRALGLLMCTALVVGNTIGVGIFLLPASLSPYGLNALPGWLITTGGSICIAWVFAGLARSFSTDDGPYAYSARAFGNGFAFVIMWCYWISTIVTNAVLATGVVGYLSSFFPVLASNHLLAAVTAVAFIWLFVVINMRGARTAGWVQVWSSVLKVALLLGIVALGLWAWFTPQAAAPVQLPTTPLSWSGVITSSTLTLYALLGVESAAMPAGRVRDPARTIPRATFIGTLTVAVVYICVSLTPMFFIPQGQLAASSAPFADLFTRLLGPASGQVIAGFVVVSALGCLNGWTLILGELTVSCARHGGFPPSLGTVNAHGAPTRAFVLTAILASLMTLSSYNDSTANAFSFLNMVVTASNLPMYFGCALAVPVLWRRGELGKSGPRDSRWIAAAVIAALYCVWASIGLGTKSLLWALVPCAAGVPIYWWYAVLRRPALAT
jgi:basic amino acid/polyamine antiporter, APA family